MTKQLNIALFTIAGLAAVGIVAENPSFRVTVKTENPDDVDVLEAGVDPSKTIVVPQPGKHLLTVVALESTTGNYISSPVEQELETTEENEEVQVAIELHPPVEIAEDSIEPHSNS